MMMVASFTGLFKEKVGPGKVINKESQLTNM